MPKFDVYDENVAARTSRKGSKTEGNKLATKKPLKTEDRRALVHLNHGPNKVDSKPVVEGVRKSQRNEERRVLGCINNVKETNSRVVFPQKKHTKKEEDKQASKVVEETDANMEYLFAHNYDRDVVEYLKTLELKQGVRGDYMKKQAQLSHDMRSILVDWLVEVSEGLHCSFDIIFSTCHYVDRFLSIMSVNDGRLQLLGVTCLYLAWKFEDAPGCPYLADLVCHIGGVCTDKEILKMEKLVVRTLDFSLVPCSHLTFLNLFLHHQPLSPDATLSAKYLLESSLLDGQRFLKYLPSTTAAACISICREEANMPAWSDLLTQVTGYRQKDLDRCTKELSRFKRYLPIDAYCNIPLKYHKSELYWIDAFSIHSLMRRFV